MVCLCFSLYFAGCLIGLVCLPWLVGVDYAAAFGGLMWVFLRCELRCVLRGKVFNFIYFNFITLAL